MILFIYLIYFINDMSWSIKLRYISGISDLDCGILLTRLLTLSANDETFNISLHKSNVVTGLKLPELQCDTVIAAHTVTA